MSLTVSTLAAKHHGQRARVTLTPNDIRDGRLSLARNPSYQRRDVSHWWLIAPSALPHFTHDALSLQWHGGAAVELIEEQA